MLGQTSHCSSLSQSGPAHGIIGHKQRLSSQAHTTVLSDKTFSRFVLSESGTVYLRLLSVPRLYTTRTGSSHGSISVDFGSRALVERCHPSSSTTGIPAQSLQYTLYYHINIVIIVNIKNLSILFCRYPTICLLVP